MKHLKENVQHIHNLGAGNNFLEIAKITEDKRKI